MTEVPHPDDSRLQPLPSYATWWAADVACSQLTQQNSVFPTLEWWEVHDRHVDTDGDVAMTYWPQREIRVTTLYVDDERIVRHEMLHALLYAAGKTRESVTHDPLYFHDRCGLM